MHFSYLYHLRVMTNFFFKSSKYILNFYQVQTDWEMNSGGNQIIHSRMQIRKNKVYTITDE